MQLPVVEYANNNTRPGWCNLHNSHFREHAQETGAATRAYELSEFKPFHKKQTTLWTSVSEKLKVISVKRIASRIFKVRLLAHRNDCYSSYSAGKLFVYLKTKLNILYIYNCNMHSECTEGYHRS